jgi:broad specificity phosphatase PhoE
MLQITYFVHGTSTDNDDGIASGWRDASLSERGQEQAKQLGLLTGDTSFDAVYASDLRRAQESARLAFGARYEVVADARLRE